MIFVIDEQEYHQLLKENRNLLRATYEKGSFIEAWFSEYLDPIHVTHIDSLELKETPNGLFGSIAIPISPDGCIEQNTKEAYLLIFKILSDYPTMTVIRFWNYVPAINSMLAKDVPIYHRFNAGRYNAFKSVYGEMFEAMLKPAASAVGTNEDFLKIEFLAVKVPTAVIENKDQIPAYQYSEKYGKLPPFFSRGVIFENNGQRLLLSSGTASIVGENSVHWGEPYEQLSQSMQNLRILGSQFNLKRYNIHYGFALEDIVYIKIYYKNEHDRPFFERFVSKYLAPNCKIAYQQAELCREELLVELEAVFVKKGETEHGKEPKYTLNNDQRIRIESFEIHVAEHCNLKCRDCCNISPFNPKKFLSLEEVQEICCFVKQHFSPDVFKIAGGEPTLHPQLDDILQLVKQSGVCNVTRVITNGLLLHRMSEKFWKSIDQLTISNYISAPIRPKVLEEVKEKAKFYEVVLNIKYVEQFNEIFVDEPIEDKNRVQNIYNDCWMRHRCLIIRNNHFNKCTRSSYMDSFLKLKDRPNKAGNSTYSIEDGIALNDPDFKEKALLYLNSNSPLHSCEYCLGVSGNLRENVQLKLIR